MTRLLRHLVTSLMICLSSLLVTMPALAIPALPSSFYGEVKVNGKVVPDGTVVRALIDGEVYAEGHIRPYENISVYALDVPGDDAGTAEVEGGREGNVIHFEIGDVLVDQTGVWHSGVNIRLDLTASAAEPLASPQSTPSGIPTQTAISIQLSPTRAVPAESAHPEANTTQPLPAATMQGDEQQISTPTKSSQKQAVFAQPQPSPSENMHSSPVPVAPMSSEKMGAQHSTPTVTILAVVIVIGSAVWVARERMYSVRKPNRSEKPNTQGGSQ